MTPLLFVCCISFADPARADTDLAAQLERLDADVLESIPGRQPTRDPSGMLRRDVRERIEEANRRSTRAWRSITDTADWKAWSVPRIRALRHSLGTLPSQNEPLDVRRTGVIRGQGYQIEKITFLGRPDSLVTANLYRPADPMPSMPGMLICHSHHNPKTQGELQDMGITWAKQGCAVLVMDQLGHGERRQHPFEFNDDYPGEFRRGRQDYYFRYNVGLQLYLVGDSLVGWMAGDLMRGVDVLLQRANADADRLILLGAVAGGGDPAAVTAALDERIDAVVPFNFGGPEPENEYPLPANAVDTFNYAGSGGWEPTRALRLSARDGFLPWVIVGSIAPRRLIYAHEFSWDREHDPVWKRLGTIFRWYDAEENLDFVHGFGLLRGRPPEASHCNNIGPPHRAMIYPAFERWFGLPVPKEETSERRAADVLHCFSAAEAAEALTPLHRLADKIAAGQLERFRRNLGGTQPADRRQILRERWTKLLGDIEPYDAQVAKAPRDDNREPERIGPVLVERLALSGEREIVIPTLLLRPPGNGQTSPCPLIVAVAQSGKAGFLQHRATQIAALLREGIAVCLPDLRGTGETAPGRYRGRSSAATSIAATELMLGQTLLGSRLKDLRSLLSYLRTRPEFDGQPVALWGDSFAAINSDPRELQVPLDASHRPAQAEPLGHLLVLLAGLFDEEIDVLASSRGGLVSFRSVLQSRFIYVPHDGLVPGALAHGDLQDVAAVLAPRPAWYSSLVTGVNQRASESEMESQFELVTQEYVRLGAADQLQLHRDESFEELAAWLAETLRAP